MVMTLRDSPAVLKALQAKGSVQANITLIKKEYDLNTLQFAKQLGVSHTAVQKWEAGESYPSGFNMIWLHELAEDIRAKRSGR